MPARCATRRIYPAWRRSRPRCCSRAPVGAAHPYGRPLAGNDSSVTGLSRERVVAFYGSFYRPNIARLLVVGDVTLDEARQLVTARFGAWARGEAPVTAVGAAPQPSPRTIY